MIRIFIGYDKAEPVCYHTLCQSIIEYNSEPVSITPLVRKTLPVNPTRDPKASTDFADTRFLVPYLCNHEGWAIFIDSDELFTVDPVKLWELQDPTYAVMVRKHNHDPNNKTKFLNQEQTRYKYKNWSSLMLFNNARCKALTPGYINSVPGLDLHQFKWLESDKEIGELPNGWNHLVGYSEYEGTPPLIHYTDGSPSFSEYKNCEYSSEWWEMYQGATYCQQTHEK